MTFRLRKISYMPGRCWRTSSREATVRMTRTMTRMMAVTMREMDRMTRIRMTRSRMTRIRMTGTVRIRISRMMTVRTGKTGTDGTIMTDRNSHS